MSDIEVLRKLTKIFNELKKDDEEGHSSAYELQWEDISVIENLIIENKELKERINKSIEFINDDDTFFNDGESWQNVLHIERILKGE